MQFSRSRYDLQPKKLYRMPCFAPFADGVRDDFYRFNGSLTELQVSLSFALDPLALRIEISSRLLQLVDHSFQLDSGWRYNLLDELGNLLIRNVCFCFVGRLLRWSYRLEAEWIRNFAFDEGRFCKGRCGCAFDYLSKLRRIHRAPRKPAIHELGLVVYGIVIAKKLRPPLAWPLR